MEKEKDRSTAKSNQTANGWLWCLLLCSALSVPRGRQWLWDLSVHTGRTERKKRNTEREAEQRCEIRVCLLRLYERDGGALEIFFPHLHRRATRKKRASEREQNQSAPRLSVTTGHLRLFGNAFPLAQFLCTLAVAEAFDALPRLVPALSENPTQREGHKRSKKNRSLRKTNPFDRTTTMNFSRRFLGPSVECYRLSLEFETPPLEVIDVAANGGSSGGGVGGSGAVAAVLSASSSPSKPIAAATGAKPLPSSPPPPPPPRQQHQGPQQTLQSIEDQWRKRASADHRNYTSVVVEWSSNESAAAVGARAAAAVAVRQGDESGVGGVGGGAPTVERVSLSFLPSSSESGGGVSAKLSVSRVRARLARLEFSRGGSGGGGASAAAAAAAAPAATNGGASTSAGSAASAAASEATTTPEHSHPVAAILAALPLEGLRRVRCCEGTVLEALEALLPAEVEVEVEAVAAAEEGKKKEKEGGEGEEAPAPTTTTTTTAEEAPSLPIPPPSVPASLHRSPRHSLLRIRSLCLTRCGTSCFCFGETKRDKENDRERQEFLQRRQKRQTHLFSSKKKKKKTLSLFLFKTQATSTRRGSSGDPSSSSTTPRSAAGSCSPTAPTRRPTGRA